MHRPAGFAVHWLRSWQVCHAGQPLLAAAGAPELCDGLDIGTRITVAEHAPGDGYWQLSAQRFAPQGVAQQRRPKQSASTLQPKGAAA